MDRQPCSSGIPRLSRRSAACLSTTMESRSPISMSSNTYAARSTPMCGRAIGSRDSHVMEQIFDKVVEYNSRFEVEQFRIGRTNSDPSYLRLKVEAPSQDVMDHLLGQLLGLGCSPVDSGDAQLSEVERDRCAPEDF